MPRQRLIRTIDAPLLHVNLTVRWVVVHFPVSVNQMGEGRSPAGCDKLPMNDVLKAQEKETRYEED